MDMECKSTMTKLRVSKGLIFFCFPYFAVVCLALIPHGKIRVRVFRIKLQMYIIVTRVNGAF